MSRSNFNSGISLIEVTIVLACATTLFAVAVPNIGMLYERWCLWGAARTVESSLRWGRAQAVAANSSVMFVVDEGGRLYFWQDPETGARFESTVRHLPAQVQLSGFPRKPLRFSPRGNAVPAGTYVLQGDAGLYRVVVNTVGRIRVERD